VAGELNACWPAFREFVPTVVGQPVLVITLFGERGELSYNAAVVSQLSESSILGGLIAHLVSFLRLI